MNLVSLNASSVIYGRETEIADYFCRFRPLMTVSCGNGLITRLNLRINSTKKPPILEKEMPWPKKVKSTTMSYQRNPLLLYTRRKNVDGNLWVSLVKRIGRICTEKGCAHYPCKLPVFLLVYLLGVQISVPINPFFV